MQQHPRQRPARALTPVRPAPRRRLDLAVRLQGQAKPVVAQPKAVLANQLLVEVLGREVPVARLEQPQHIQHLVDPHAPGRGPAQAPVVETFRPLGLVAVPPTPEGPLRHPQDLRRLALAQLATVAASVNLLELHQPQSL